MLVKDVVNYLETRFPKSLALDFDIPRIGLIIGSYNIEVNNILLTLDLTEQVVDEAIEKNVNLIISHHPYLFDSLYKIDFDSPKGKTIRKMFAHNISLYSMHTNLDTGLGGVNDVLASKLFIKDPKVINGEISKGNLLRYGNVEKQTVREYALKVKESLKLSGVRVSGDLDKIIDTVGVIGGSGAHPSDLQDAINNGCNCYVTGEVKLNNAIDAFDNGLTIIEVNHGVEKEVFYSLCDELRKNLDFGGEISVTIVQTDPFQSL